MLGGSFAKPVCSEPENKHVRMLRHIRAMMAVIMAVHIIILGIVIAGAITGTRTINYYSTYLADPLSGPNVRTRAGHHSLAPFAVRNHHYDIP